jgi:predicted PurR-regulated permease PerM
LQAIFVAGYFFLSLPVRCATNFEEKDMDGTGVGATVIMVMTLFGILVAILWVLMPFAIFGTKDLLRTLIKEQKKTNELLQAQANRAKEIREQAAALRTSDTTGKD